MLFDVEPAREVTEGTWNAAWLIFFLFRDMEHRSAQAVVCFDC